MKRDDIKKANKIKDDLEKYEKYENELKTILLGYANNNIYQGIKVTNKYGKTLDLSDDDIYYNLNIESEITEFLNKVLEKCQDKLKILNDKLDKI